MANYGKIVTVPVGWLSDLNRRLDVSDDIVQYYANQNRFDNTKLNKALKALEEGERIQRDTQNLLTRAKIELRRRHAQREQASRNAAGGLFG